MSIRLTDELIKEIQHIELEMLVEFDRICRKHDIPYSIDGGTLLGAVRHGGFIPWDDDADVIVNRGAYNKFLSVVEDELDSTRFYFQDMNNTKGYRWGYGKLRRKGTKFVREYQEHMPYDQGVFMDVFVCDNVPENYLFRCVVNFHSYIYRKFFYSEIGFYRSKGLAKCIYGLMKKVPEEVLKIKYNAYVRYRDSKKSKYVKCLTFPACNRFYGYKRSWYEDIIDMDFSGVKLKCAREYDEYLSFLFGNYMELPPIEKRKCHPVSELSLLIGRCYDE